MPTTLSLLVLRSRDVEITRDFYRSLGFQFQQEQHGTGPIHFAADYGGIVLEIYPLAPDQSEVKDSIQIGVQVNSLEEALSNLEGENTIKTTGKWGRFCVVQDPDGRKVRLTEKSG